MSATAEPRALRRARVDCGAMQRPRDPEPPPASAAVSRKACTLGALAIGLAAAALRLTDLGPARELAFLKYPAAADLWAAGELTGRRALDFSPLYLEVVRGLHALAAGTDPIWLLLLLQAVLGAGACSLVFAIAARLGGFAAGLVAGLSAAFSLDLVLYDRVLEPEPFYNLFATLSVFCALLGASLEGRRASLAAAGAGAALGLTVATRPSGWLLLPALALALLLRTRGPRRWRAFAFAVGLLLVVSPLQERNASLSATSRSPWPPVYEGNGPMATGLWSEEFVVRDLALTFDAASPDFAHESFRAVAIAEGASPQAPERYWLYKTLAFVTTHPGRALAVLAQKFLALGQLYNHHDIAAVFTLEEDLSHWPLLATSWLLALGVAGLVAAGRPAWVPGAAFLAHLVVCFAFYVTARYRVTALPWACVGIGLLAATAGRAVRTGARRVRLAAGGVVGAALAALFHAPLPPALYAREVGAQARACHTHEREARWHVQHDRLQAARAALEPCIVDSPRMVRFAQPAGLPFDVERVARTHLAGAGPPPDDAWAWYRRGYHLELAGRPGEAAEAYARAADLGGRRLRPLAYDALVRRGVSLLAIGRDSEARAAFEGADALQPDAAEAAVGLVLTETDPAARERLGQRALRSNSRASLLYFEGRMLLEAGRPREAVPDLRALVGLFPAYGRARVLLAEALRGSGEPDAAAFEAVAGSLLMRGLTDLRFGPLPALRASAERAASDPGRWRRYAWLAEIHRDLQEAIHAWHRVAALRPLEAEEEVRLADLYRRSDMPAQAESHLARARQLDADMPRDPPGLAAAQRGLSEWVAEASRPSGGAGAGPR